MGQPQQRINMFNSAVYRIQINGKLGESWAEYFGAQSVSVKVDETGHSTTTMISEPIDQSALVGMINRLNGLGLPVVSIESVQAPVRDRPAEQNAV
jgi:hypothetical protein